MQHQLVALGLGSNLDSPVQYLRQALHELKHTTDLRVLNVSSIYESDAQLPENAPADWNLKFLNAVVLCEVAAHFKPLELLYVLKKLEVKMGRLQNERWAPRPIDIDILAWQGVELQNADLVLPHARLSERPFALMPLLEVWPEAPIQNKPDWARDWVGEKPFRTQKSAKYFWPQFVAILNITSDSFSDGGKLLNADQLLHHAEKQLQAGAEILDFGAESTRPQASFVSQEVEYKNLKWALDQIRPLKKKFNFKISLDSRNPSVVKQILDHSHVDYLNDVSGLNSQEMQRTLKAAKIDAFVMHSLSIPPTPKDVLDPDCDPFEELAHWWNKKKAQLKEAGIVEDHLIFDPGIGFGKTPMQNIFILKHLEKFADIKNPIMIGHSRKSFQKVFSNQTPERRDLETALVTQSLNKAYAQFLRVHDVESQKSALRY